MRRIPCGPLLLVVLTCVSLRAADQPEEANADRVARLIRQLGDNDFFIRERAQAELVGIGFEAFDALSDAETDDDIEIAARARFLLRKMRIQWATDSDPPSVKEILKDYEKASDSDRLQLMQKLAQLPDEAGLLALCRLVRFEQKPKLSKHAALRIIEQSTDDKTDWDRRERAIQETLRRSHRPPAKWLKAYLEGRHNLDAAVTEWSELAAAEDQTRQQYPEQSEAEIVMALLRQQVEWLDRLKRSDETLEVLKKMVELAGGDTNALRALAVQLYQLADKRDQRGEHDSAQQVADQARIVNPGNPLEHLRVAFQLKQLGMFKWSEQEFRHVISIGPPGREYALRSQWLLAEMLHDQEKELSAAEVLQASAAAMQENVRQGNAQQNLSREPGETRARMHYFFANHFAEQGDRARQIEHLEAAIKDNPLDADVLIGMYRLSEQTPEWKQRTQQLIKKAADSFRREIESNPDDPQNSDPYNQLAWLIGNTEGDYAEATKASLKSIELGIANQQKINVGGYYDTLGRCYYAQGDLENAVKNQTKAVELDPHSGQMRRQLTLFQKALAEKQK